MRFPSRALSAAVLVLCLVSLARAQTGSDLLLKPLLSDKEVVEVRADALFFDQGHTDNGTDFGFDLYRTSGRVQEQRENSIPRIGWDVAFYNFSTNANVPEQLLDCSVGVGLELFNVKGWRGGLSLGAGYAGDRPFAESDAWYGKGTLLVGRDLDATHTLAFVLDYDGARTTYPDIPIPGIAYRHQFDPTLSYTAGFPYDAINWHPIEPFHLDVNYLYPDTFRATADYAVVRRLGVFAALEDDRRAFHVEEIGGNDRLLFQQRRVELGIRFKPIEEAQLTGALGYGWGGEFSQGFSDSDSDKIADLSDEPYFRLGFEMRF